MVDLILNEDYELVRKLARDFSEKVILPKNKIIENETIPREIYDELGKIGFTGVIIPHEYGGAGFDTLSYVIILEELARISPSVSVAMDVQNGLVEYPILTWGSDYLKNKYLPKLARGEWIGGYALTEPQAGSDAANVQLKAVKKGSEYILSGNKFFITNANHANVFIIFARTGQGPKRHEGITAFVVEKNYEGFHVGEDYRKLGVRGSSTAELVLDNVHVPEENILGEMGKGFYIAMNTLNMGRIGIGAQALGIAQASLEKSIEYMKQREAFGKKLADFEGLQFQIAEISTDVEAARLLIYDAAMRADKNLPLIKEASMAKYFSSKVAMDASRFAIQVHGGYGFIEDFDVERYYRDAKITEIYEGTTEIQKIVIARELLK
ncbi:MAG: acyl-CoA dehydrogenase family protein [Thermoplasmata archaeon]